MYGTIMLGQSLLFSPNFSSAKTCAARILNLINRDPIIKTEPGIRNKEDWVYLFIIVNISPMLFTSIITTFHMLLF